MKSDKSHRGNASQFFIAGELCRRGLVAVVTMGNCPNTDILCSNREGTKFAHIQVKTFVPGTRTCSVGMKAEIDYGQNFFWVLGGIPIPGSPLPFEYFIIPSPVMAREVASGHQSWLQAVGRKGQARRESTIRIVDLPPFCVGRRWDISDYKNRWDLIEQKLK